MVDWSSASVLATFQRRTSSITPSKEAGLKNSSSTEFTHPIRKLLLPDTGVPIVVSPNNFPLR